MSEKRKKEFDNHKKADKIKLKGKNNIKKKILMKLLNFMKMQKNYILKKC